MVQYTSVSHSVSVNEAPSGGAVESKKEAVRQVLVDVTTSSTTVTHTIRPS